MPGESAKDDDANDLSKHPVIRQLAKGLMGLGNIVTQLGKSQKESVDKLDKLTTFLEEGRGTPTKKGKQSDPPPDDDSDDGDDDSELTDDDLNSMSQAQ